MREDLTQRRFIEETYRIISTEGREALSIRRLARDMHCNSANIYRYFKDLDELVTYASLRYLTAYLGDVAVCYAKSETTYQTHVAVWDCFSRHAFANGPIFDNLFFGRHSRMLNDIIKNYYAMFRSLPLYRQHIQRRQLQQQGLSHDIPLRRRGMVHGGRRKVSQQLLHTPFSRIPQGAIAEGTFGEAFKELP